MEKTHETAKQVATGIGLQFLIGWALAFGFGIAVGLWIAARFVAPGLGSL